MFGCQHNSHDDDDDDDDDADDDDSDHDDIDAFQPCSNEVSLPRTHAPVVSGTLFTACPTACPFRSYSGSFIQIGWIYIYTG